MSVDVVEQLRSLTRSFDEFVGEVTSDEVMGEHTDDEGRDRRLTQVAAAVIVLALIGGLAALMQLRDAGAPSDGGTLSGAALADALVGRVWVAIDYPLPQLPFMRLSDGDGSTGVELVGSDGCNDQSGPFRLDGNTVAGSQIGSTDVGCSTPRIAGVWDGTTLTVDSGTLTVTDSSGTSTRWLPLDALSPIAPNELVGSYTMGTATITVTPDAVTTDGCERSWTADESTLRFTSSRCDLQGPATFVLLNAPEWSVVGDDQRVVVQIDRRFVRLDRTDADAPARPGLASFLGAIGDRTWVYDAPSPDYPLARRPSLRPPPSWNEAGAQLVAGFDGCNAYALNGSWTASGEGWQVADAAGSGTLIGCGERPTVEVTNGSVLSLTPDGLLSVAAPDGNVYLFRDIRAATFADMTQSPVAELPGRWELDPGVLLDIKLGTGPDGIGVITFGTCGVNWWPTGNEWIGAGPVPADCVPPAESPSAAALVALLDTGPTGTTPGPVERPITVGVNPERNVLYLANDDGSIVVRLTRLDTDPTPPNDSVAALAGPTWWLKDVLVDGTPVAPPPEGLGRGYFEFVDDLPCQDCPDGPKLVGYDLCNSFQMAVAIDDGFVTRGGWNASTLVGCDGVAAYEAINELLWSGTGFSYTLSADRLVLTSEDGTTELILSPNQPSAR
jgi:heat shock protein HslJ